MDLKNWLIIAATILGPILAVQAQKAVEAIRERRGRKTWVFSQLMATRAARVSPDHVCALNMIDLVFYGHRILGVLRRSKREQAVLDAWNEYLDHLSTKAGEGELSLWTARGDELFTNLLFSIAQDVGFVFDRVQLKKGAYSPVAHGDIESEQMLLRRAAIHALAGETALKMNVVGFPVDPEVVKAQTESAQRLSAALEDGTLKVLVDKPSKPCPNKLLQGTRRKRLAPDAEREMAETDNRNVAIPADERHL